VLFVGRLQPRKRIDNLLRACAALPEGVQPELWIVGEGPARMELQRQAGAIYPQTKFFGERRGHELDALFTTADLFVLPGTGGLAVQEAMAHGLPVIVAQGDGTQTDLVRPENGWLIPPDDLQALEAVLGEAFSDPARLRRMGAESYRIVAEEVNLEAMVGIFVQALCSVTGQNR
jgi:glycosyltransferase involved in cell wall biosynthesis